VIALRLSPRFPTGRRAAGVLGVQARGDRIDCTWTLEKRLPDILKWLCDRGVLIRDCQVREPDLERFR
jgi:hypothetical protein